jgi:hypothetical protein
MTDPTPEGDRRFVRVGRAAHVVTLHGEATTPDDRPVSTGKWVRVSRPALPVVTLCAEPVLPVNLEVAFPVAGGMGPALLDKVAALIDGLSEFETSLGGAGVTRDLARSRAEGGTVTLVFVPNDPAGSAERLSAFAKVAATAVELVVGSPVTVAIKPAA